MVGRLDSVRRARPLLGTFVEITAGGGEACQLEPAIEAAFDTVERVHWLMSYHEPESDVSRLNRAAGRTPIVIDAWTYSVLQTALELHWRSKGLFNVGVGSALERLGLLPQSAGTTYSDPMPCTPVELLLGSRAQLHTAGSTIDLGGIAKGFAVDQAIAVLREYDVPSGLVNAGGDLAGFGPHEHVVAIRDPRGPDRVLAHTALCNAAIASSGMGFDPASSLRVSHCPIIDPRSGGPVTAVIGATVRAGSCMIADALTKVVMIAALDASELLDHYAASALFVTTDGEVLATVDWQDANSFAT
jgi:thiamine biosynthesis lipoprotein